ncbi:diacylglycerol kinase family lipid kinase [bacterium]|nr:diacylglycerol kinase family lipid kinase [bacterium]
MTVFVVNPRAAHGRTASRWARLEASLLRLGLSGEVRFTEGPGHARHLTAQALSEGARRVVAVGGDGTIHEVMNGFFDDRQPRSPEATLGILPTGTGGDLIRTLGIPRDPLKAAEHLLSGRQSLFDVGRAEFVGADGHRTVRHFVNIAEAGLGGAAVDRINRGSKVLGGFLTFLAGTLHAFATYQPGVMSIAFDDEAPLEGRAWNVVVGNGRYFGGGMHILPEARMDDGLFDVMVVGDVSRAALFRNVAAIYRGTHLSEPGVAFRRAREVRVRCARPLLLDLDGEAPGTTDAHFSIMPQVLRLSV